MALTATMRRFEISLADADRERYAQLDLRVAQHPSESLRYLVARVLARVLEDADGVEFSKGLDADDEPALWQHDLRGDLQAWIEVGLPAVPRLHKASKRCRRVAVYGWQRLPQLAGEVVAAKVHKADQLELYQLDEAMLDAVGAGLDRNNHWDLSRSGGAIYLTVGETLHETQVTQIPIPWSAPR
jgi:uncharacterized protein YaeQ